MADARYEDGDEGPLRLLAQGAEDLPVVSALVQDAVLPAVEMRYDARRRRFVALVNRFRWEDREAAVREGRPFERVRSLLTVEDVTAVRTQGIDRRDADLVLSILSLDWQPGEDGTGRLTLVLAGDGAVALEVETLELRLDDVTKPYIAPSRHAPDHGA
ncbi:DUF2948 family protein [Pseudogemmobacter blasticus]|uniref:DUF2948 domain-containing protein n=1 Tax=Fuscovulum blasticum DSM 2131 TaxID=1188250 RepID=A0A2T4JCW5_FUSBL|nr:DUF2948 family protein [Fuscovulum blasticum]PTE15729.1 DUF2948 domain-containing protein [Fuscovulum blasticum DSM 2131]